MKDLYTETLKEERLEDIEEVISLDKIGADGKEHRYLVYFQDPSTPYYGTDILPHEDVEYNDFITHLVMRAYKLEVSEAIEKCIKEQTAIVIEDLETMLVVPIYYVTLH